jgi:hypothetical protein
MGCGTHGMEGMNILAAMSFSHQLSRVAAHIITPVYHRTAQAVKRSLCVLPYSPQSLSDSPYLDHALFSYDEKVISASDR